MNKSKPSLLAIRETLFQFFSRFRVLRASLAVYAMFGHRKAISKQLLNARREASRILELEEGSRVLVAYDTSCASVGYGDFLGTVLTARYISRLGHRVVFALVDSPGRRRSSWENMDRQTTDDVIADFLKIAIQYSSAKVELFSGDQLRKQLEHSQNFDHVLFRDLVQSGAPFYLTDMALLNFASLSKSGPDPSGLLTWIPQGYVAWHVRFAKHAVHRNPSKKIILNDARALLSHFPKLQIRVFSDERGRDFVLKTLGTDAKIWREVVSGRLMLQKSSNFIESIEEGSRASFWFQRLGGGVGVVPLFTKMPFICITDDNYNFRRLGGSGKRLFAWHSSQQIWSLQSLNATTVRLEKLLRNSTLSKYDFK